MPGQLQKPWNTGLVGACTEVRASDAVDLGLKETMDVTAKIPMSAIFLSMTFSP